jgi:hypothetical protein
MRMKKFLMMATVFAFTVVMSQSIGLTPAYADDQGGQSAAHHHFSDGKDGKPSPEKFKEIKANILKKMEERRQKLNKAEACVKAASDPDALRACMPKRDGKRGEWKHGDNNGKGGGFMRHHRDGGDNGGGDQ